MSFGVGEFGAQPYGLRSLRPLEFGWGGGGGPPPGGGGDGLATDAGFFSQITRLEWVSSEVVSDVDLVSVVARAIFSGVAEVIYDGEHFAEQYRRGSTVESIPSGVRLVIRRTGGWPTSEFRLLLVVQDIAGVVTIGQPDFT